MSSQIVPAILLAFVFFTSVGGRIVTSAPVCDPPLIETMPANIRELCVELEYSNQLSNTLAGHIQKEVTAYLYKPNNIVQPSTGKRTDVDHVFLRFGRR